MLVQNEALFAVEAFDTVKINSSGTEAIVIGYRDDFHPKGRIYELARCTNGETALLLRDEFTLTRKHVAPAASPSLFHYSDDFNKRLQNYRAA